MASLVQPWATNSGNSSITLTLGTAPRAGNTLILLVESGFNGADEISSVTTTGVTWARKYGVQSTHVTVYYEVWTGEVGSNAGTAVTITAGLSGDLICAAVGEFAGLASTTPDTTNMASGTSQIASGPTLTPTEAGDVFFCVGSGQDPPVSNVNWTQISFPQYWASYLITTSASPQTPSFTMASSGNWTNAAAAFKTTALSSTHVTDVLSLTDSSRVRARPARGHESLTVSSVVRDTRAGAISTGSFAVSDVVSVPTHLAYGGVLSGGTAASTGGVISGGTAAPAPTSTIYGGNASPFVQQGAPTDAVSFSEVLGATSRQKRLLSDSLSFSDTPSHRQKASPGVVTDSLTVSQSVARKSLVSRGFGDTVSLVDSSEAQTAALHGGLLSGGTAASTGSLVSGGSASPASTAVVYGGNAGIAIQQGVATDDIVFGETKTASVQVRALDALVVTVNVKPSLLLSRRISDAFSVVDASSLPPTSGIISGGTAAGTGGVLSGGGAGSAPTQTIYGGNAGSNQQLVHISDAFVLSDKVRDSQQLITAVEKVAVSDIARIARYPLHLHEVSHFSDTSRLLSQPGRAVDHLLTVLTARIQTQRIYGADSVVVSGRARLSAQRATAQDALTLEIISRSSRVPAAVHDSISALSVVRLSVRFTSFDHVVVSDGVNHTVRLGIVANDAMFVSQSVRTNNRFGRSLTSIVTLAENLHINRQAQKALDGLGISDIARIKHATAHGADFVHLVDHSRLSLQRAHARDLLALTEDEHLTAQTKGLTDRLSLVLTHSGGTSARRYASESTVLADRAHIVSQSVTSPDSITFDESLARQVRISKSALDSFAVVDFEHISAQRKTCIDHFMFAEVTHLQGVTFLHVGDSTRLNDAAIRALHAFGVGVETLSLNEKLANQVNSVRTVGQQEVRGLIQPVLMFEQESVQMQLQPTLN